MYSRSAVTMMCETVVFSFLAFTLANSHKSVATLMERSGVIVARTQSLNPNTNQGNHWQGHQRPHTKDVWQLAK
jgi:hypothetical protein